MADFCSICIGQLASGDLESTNIGDILLNNRLLMGGDIKIEELFHDHMISHMDELLNDEKYCLTVPGICEHCGLTRLSVKKENNITYLVAWCYKTNLPDNTGKYKIAIINGDKLEWVEDEIIKLYNE